MAVETSNQKQIIVWLSVLIIMVFTMVFIGGVTRLTDSGLSMVDWKPIVGAIPPISEADWASEFDKYKAFPEYQKVNYNMTLSEFKYIFFWEWFHRLWGRLIGLAFFFPFVYFLVKKKMDSKLTKKVFVAFILGGLQGLMGWYMVKSGLVNKPDVSQYRLCAHLLLAFTIIGYIYYIILTLNHPRTLSRVVKPMKNFMLFFTGLLILQISYGAIVAGLDAGLTHNTFPKMGREWFPSEFFMLSPWQLNFFENVVAVQFIHRTLGWLLVACGIFIYVKRNSISDFMQKKSIKLVLVMILVQFLLGVGTIVMHVPLAVASIHQLGAVVLFLLTIRALYFSLTDKEGTAVNAI